MKHLLAIIPLLLILFGCSSLELDSVLSSEQETQRILAMGLSHEENLAEAKKLDTPHMVSVVTLQLKNARDEEIQAAIDSEKSSEFAEKVSISNDGNSFSSLEISESLQSGILSTDVDFLKYNFESKRNLENNIASHDLNLSLVYNSKRSRNYHSFSFCDQWNNCAESTEIRVISVNGSNCKNNKCDYEEVFQVQLTDEFLKNTINDGFSMRLISDSKTNKIEISKAYLMGYLKVAQ